MFLIGIITTVKYNYASCDESESAENSLRTICVKYCVALAVKYLTDLQIQIINEECKEIHSVLRYISFIVKNHLHVLPGTSW